MVPRINKILERALSGYMHDKIDYTTKQEESHSSAPSSGIKEL